MDNLLFVYGTLMQGYPRHKWLKKTARFVGYGRIRAQLYDFGAYPGAVLNKAQFVHGEVYQILRSEETLSELDRVEGFSQHSLDESLFRREQVEVLLDGGQTVKCWTYFYNRSCEKAPLIPSGKYRDASLHHR